MTSTKMHIGSLLLILASLFICDGAQAETKGQSVVERNYERFLQRPIANEDIEILKRADEILSNETIWDRNDTRTCYRLAESWSLFCALQEACIEVTGSYDHRRVAIEEVRFEIEDVAGWFNRPLPFHPLMEYNNLPTTKFEDIKKVLKIALEKEEARKNRVQ